MNIKWIYLNRLLWSINIVIIIITACLINSNNGVIMDGNNLKQFNQQHVNDHFQSFLDALSLQIIDKQQVTYNRQVFYYQIFY